MKKTDGALRHACRTGSVLPTLYCNSYAQGDINIRLGIIIYE